MTAVRLRGNDSIERALEARRMNLEDGLTINQIADHYDATPRAVHEWLKLARKHTLPALDDQLGWFNLIVKDQGARLEDAKDTDSVAIAKNLSQLLGVGSLEQMKQQMVRLEQSKVLLIAQALDTATQGQPNREQIRERFLDAIEASPV